MKGRFTGWVILFFVILALVPVFIINSAVTIAKILGIILVVAIVAALWKWRIQTRERSPRNERIKLNTNDKFWLEKNIPFYQKLSKRLPCKSKQQQFYAPSTQSLRNSLVICDAVAGSSFLLPALPPARCLRTHRASSTASSLRANEAQSETDAPSKRALSRT